MNKIIIFALSFLFSNVALANWIYYQSSGTPKENDYTIIIDLIMIGVYIYLWYRYLHNWTLENAYYGAIFPMLITLLAFFYRELFVAIRSALLYLF
jgi:hypothetical protein